MAVIDSFTKHVADYASNVRFDVLPTNVVFRAKCVILDELACMVLGRSLPVGQYVAKYVAEAGGAPQAAVAGTRLRTSPALAAMANGTAAHADELDGAHITGGHPGGSVVASSLAVGEKVGATGRELITAAVLAYDIGTRMIDAVGSTEKLRRRHLKGDMFHAFGGVAGAGSLLGLSPDQQRYAAALTAAQTVSLTAFFSERRHMTKSFTSGHVAHSAVTAAMLAHLGVEGNEAIYEDVDGVFAAYSDDDDPRSAVFDDLGTRYAIVDTNFKFHSCGFPIQAPVEASLGLMADHSVESSDIVGIEVRTANGNYWTVNERDMPSICLQDMLSVAIAFGRLGFNEAHDEKNLGLPEVVRLRKAIDFAPDPEFDKVHPPSRGAAVALTLTDGRVLRRTVDWPYGHSQRGDIVWGELASKVRSVLDGLMPAGDVDRLIGTVDGLDSEEDARDLGQAVQADVGLTSLV